ncbi:MAG: uracil phosphoribosyltransferase [Pseudomonadota bacterium]
MVSPETAIVSVMHPSLTVLDHPLITHRLATLRNKETRPPAFRRALDAIATMLAVEATRDFTTVDAQIETPLETTSVPVIDEEAICLASILRAGNGLLDGFMDLLPRASVAHIGLYRNHETLDAVSYYFRAPSNLGDKTLLLLDPMLATGHTAYAAIEKLKSSGAAAMKFVCLVAAPEGVAFLEKHAADVPIITAALDRELNDKGYILPGLGDAGDRIYGTE